MNLKRKIIENSNLQIEAKILAFPKIDTSNNLLRKRGYALVTDLFMVGIIKKTSILSMSYFLKAFFYQLHVGDQITLLNGMEPFNIILTFPILAGYFFFSFFLGEGKTVGSLIFKITVKNEQGNSPTFKQATLRSTGYLLGYLSAGLLFALPMIRKDKKGLGDLFSQTYIYEDTATVEEKEFVEEFKKAA